jgi:hypothetical protein
VLSYPEVSLVAEISEALQNHSLLASRESSERGVASRGSTPVSVSTLVSLSGLLPSGEVKGDTSRSAIGWLEEESSHSCVK